MTLPERPGGGDRPGLPGIGDRPDRPGYGNRPGFGNRPIRPPENRPNRGDRLDRINDRLANRYPSQLPARDRWENRWWNHYHHHHHWFHGHWNPNYWGPGSRWNYWWDNYPVMSAFGLTTWAINRIGWAFGYYDYRNPYYVSSPTVVSTPVVYDYSQPIVMMPTEQTLAGDPADTAAYPEPPPEALSEFDLARQSFYGGSYDQALAQVDAAIAKMPNDAVLHEFRSLTLFALARYQESAATLYPVLSVGPGWDWTTMIGLYPNVDEYTRHLRALEAYRKSHTDDPSPRFLLAYHYLTAGHDDAAKSQLQNLVQMTPDDPLARRLLLELDPNAEVPEPPQEQLPPKPSAKVEASQLYGTWTAERGDGEFVMALKDNGDFDWKFTQNGQSQEVTGVWSVDEQGVLAMEMNDGGTMLAQLNPTAANKLDFYMIGDTEGAEPLHFSK